MSPSHTPEHMVVEGATSCTLEAAGLPACALAIWHRRLEPDLSDQLERLSWADMGDLDGLFATADPPLVEQHLAAAGYPAAVSHVLANDIAALVRIFITVACSPAIRLRLEWIETDACRRFHMDMLTTRLLSTYVGPGTQWKLATWDDARAVGLRAGDVAILKGRLLAPDAPVLHRSPPIVASGEQRLLLTLDTVPAATSVPVR